MWEFCFVLSKYSLLMMAFPDLQTLHLFLTDIMILKREGEKRQAVQT